MRSDISATPKTEAEEILVALNTKTRSVTRTFSTSDILATGVRLQEGWMYQISIAESEPWKDASHEADPDGLIDEPSLFMSLVNFRTRMPSVKYFQLLGSIADPAADPFVVKDGQIFVPCHVPSRGPRPAHPDR